MKTLPDDFKAKLSKFWVVQKTANKFSSMPIDQCHEQNNAIVEGEGGMIGLTENPTTFRKWAVAAPEQSHLIKEFESTFLDAQEVKNTDHHSQTTSSHKRCKQDVISLLAGFKNYGNTFKEICPEQLEIHTRKILLSKMLCQWCSLLYNLGKSNISNLFNKG